MGTHTQVKKQKSARVGHQVGLTPNQARKCIRSRRSRETQLISLPCAQQLRNAAIKEEILPFSESRFESLRLEEAARNSSFLGSRKNLGRETQQKKSLNKTKEFERRKIVYT